MLEPVQMNRAGNAIFAIKPADVRKIVAKRPGRVKKK